MAWDDAPPTAEELQAVKAVEENAPVEAEASDWTSAPPTAEELAASGATPGQLEAALRSGVQGISQGYADEATGAGEALYDKFLGQDSGKSLGELYDQHTAESRANNAAAEQAWPKTYLAGSLAGGVGSGLALTGLAPLAAAAKAAPILYGAGTGALAGVGHGNAHNAADAIGAGLKGGALGGLLGGISKLLTPGTATNLKSGANKAAVKSIEPNPGDYKQLIREGLSEGKGIAASEDALGKWLLQNKVVTLPASLAEKMNRVQALKEQSGQDIGRLIGVLDESGVQAAPLGAAGRTIERLARPHEGMESSAAAFNALNKAARDSNRIVAKDAAAHGGTSFSNLQDIKGYIGDLVEGSGGWKTLVPNQTNRSLKQAYGSISKTLEEAVESGAGADSKEALAKYLADKASYQAAHTAEDMLIPALGKQAVKKPLSLADTMHVATQVAQGNPFQAAATVGTLKTIGKYGRNVQAVGMDKLGDLLRWAPQKFGKWAVPLQQAAERGSTSLAASSFVLSQTDPEYRERLKEITAEGDAPVSSSTDPTEPTE